MSEPALLVATPADRIEGIDLSVVIPAYDEQARLPAVLASLREHVDHDRTEIVVVDDGSADRTVAVANEHGAWSPNLLVVEHGTNRGKGAAVRTGVLASSGDLIAFVDADDATDLSALGPMCDAVTGSVGAVFGSRHAPGSVVVGSPPIRGVMGRVFNHVVRYAAGTSISDTQCGAKVFRSPAARAVFGGSTVDGFAFDVEILRRLTAIGVDVVEYPVTWRYVSGTKIELLTPLRMLRDIGRIRLRPAADPDDRLVCRFGKGLDAVAAPLHPDLALVDGDSCVVLVPADTSPSIAQVRERLSDLGLLD